MTRLNKSLLANGVFSLLCGSGALLLQSSLSIHIPLAEWMWLLVGAGLIGFSIQLIAMVKLPWLAKKLTISVVYADVIWVLVTALLSVMYCSQITWAGLVLIGITSSIVGCLALLQYSGYKRQFGSAFRPVQC